MTLTPSVRTSSRIAERWICSSCRSRTSHRQLCSSFTTTSQQVTQQEGRQLPLRRDLNGPVNGLPNTRHFSTTTPRKASQRRQPKLPDTPARTRFAPSPTGYLHIGGLRTALFSYLLAKRTGGQFLLRIEDTDQKRLVPDAESKLCSDLQWAGLEWDEGPGVGGPYGPYRQSERKEIYLEHAKILLENGSAYRCFCSRQSAGGAQVEFVSSGCYQNCSHLSHEESQQKAEIENQAFTVRLRVPSDAHKRVYPDIVYGKIQRLKRSPATPLTEDGDGGVGSTDTILVKSDGTPTYHFANVVDDHLMKITHVIRGVEWSASTPLHYDIYSSFNWTPPQFAHVGLLVDRNQAKLSKRNQDLALDVASMRSTHGVLPQPLANFLALLGWSNPTQNDVMDMQSLISNFDLKFTRGNAMVRMEKLWYFQRQHVAERCALALSQKSFAPIEGVVVQIVAQVQTEYPQFAANELKLTAYITSILLADPSNYQSASQWVQRNRYFYTFSPDLIPPQKEFYDADQTITGKKLNLCAQQLIIDLESERPSQPQPADIESVLGGSAAAREQRMHDIVDRVLLGQEELKKSLVGFLREKIAMGLPGPSIYVVMALLGPEECCRRLKLALDHGVVNDETSS